MENIKILDFLVHFGIKPHKRTLVREGHVPEVSIKIEVADKFLDYIGKNRGDKHPHDYIHEVLEEAIEDIGKKKPFEKLAPIMDNSFGGNTERISYRGNLEAAANSVMIPTRLNSKRQVLREAIIEFCIKKGILQIRSGKMVVVDK